MESVRDPEGAKGATSTILPNQIVDQTRCQDRQETRKKRRLDAPIVRKEGLQQPTIRHFLSKPLDPPYSSHGQGGGEGGSV